MSEYQIGEQFKAAKWAARELYPSGSSQNRTKRNQAVKMGQELLSIAESWLDERYDELKDYYLQPTVLIKPRIVKEKWEPGSIIHECNLWDGRGEIDD